MPTNQDEPTLYDRVGGEAGISNLVTKFYARVLTDPKLSPFFEQSAMSHLRRMQMELFSTALGGPITYTGRPLREVHHGRGIKKEHVQLFVDHLLETLKGFDLTNQEIMDIISRINTFADSVTGESTVDG